MKYAYTSLVILINYFNPTDLIFTKLLKQKEHYER